MPENDFWLHLDYSNMDAMDSGELHDPNIKGAGITGLTLPAPQSPQVIDQALIKDLVQVNIQQRVNMDLLVNKLNDLSLNLSGHEFM